MLTLLHVSDLHFGPVYVPEVGEALLRSAAELKADIIVASGDFTQRAKVKQFVAARDFLGRLPDVPVIVVPGNHDIPLYRVVERLFAPYRNYCKYISAELDTTFQRDDAVIVALNTTAPWSKIVDGRVTRRQLDFCDNAFRDAPASAARIVVAHHHFAPPPDYDDRQSVVRRARVALGRFAELEVDLILSGHLHRAYVVNSLDVYPGKEHRGRITIVHSGTTTSTRGRARERGRNSFNLVQIDAGAIRVVQWLYFRELGGFAPVGRHEVPRRDRRYLGDPENPPAGSPG